MTRKEFLHTAAGAAAAGSALPNAATAAAAEKKGPKRGVSLYSYAQDLDWDTTLEDALLEISDMATPGQKMGVEILASSHVDDYPHPSAAWIDAWHDMCAKYDILPVEFCNWHESKLFNEGPNDLLDTKTSIDMLIDDIKIGSRLGFTRARTKIGIVDGDNYPTPNWREIITAILPVAEKYNFRILTEIHTPVPLKGRTMDEYLDYITKSKCSPWFGFCIDFGVFQNKPESARAQAAAPASPPRPPMQGAGARRPMPLSLPQDIIPLLPYVGCCHAKFNEMSRDCEELTIPYPEIIKILVDNQWDGYMMSEYEGSDKPVGGAFPAVRKHHVMMKRLLKEV